MISFYPGPSRVEDKIPAYVKDAFREGILSMNHRSPEFTAISKKTVTLLKQRLSIPKDYTIYFTSSATECWEIIAQSLIRKESLHLYNGAFGEKWFSYTQKLHPAATGIEFGKDDIPNPNALKFGNGEIICLTQNETSNGTQLEDGFISTLRKNNPNHLIAVDVTSSMAGVKLDFASADVWFGSVQKCFGQPAGLGLLILSPTAIARMNEINENQHYNSLVLMDKMMAQWQTSCTPNVMGIYLLMRTLADRSPISKVHAKTAKRMRDWEQFFTHGSKLKLLINNKKVQSNTVVAITGDPDYIDHVKKAAKAKGLLLGGGYGHYKKETFRIANFPALNDREIAALKKFLKGYL